MTETVYGVEAADAFVAGLAVTAQPPAIRRGDAVLVTGPWLAGSTGVVEALRTRMPDIEFVESDCVGPIDAPVAVVFVVSAAARLTESDCALLDAAAAHTDLVVCAVSKIDLHRSWRKTLDQDRALLAAHRPRYDGVAWVGVAAAPDLGSPVIDDLVETLRQRLASDQLASRNHLRAWEFRLESMVRDYENAAAGVRRRARASALREARADLRREGRLARSEHAIAMRSRIRNARVQLSHTARNRCASLRAELQEHAAGLRRRRVPGFPAHVQQRLGDVLAEVGNDVTDHLAEAAAALDLPAEAPSALPGQPLVVPPPLTTRRLEGRLTLLLGAGFGLGVALTLGRLSAGLAPGLTVAATVLCVAVGLALTVWVVATRRLLSDRAALDRWAGDALGSLRSAVDQLVATRVLAVEEEWTTVLNERGEAIDAQLAGQVRVLDAELREHALADATAIAVRGREVPGLQCALAAVRAELGHTIAGAPDQEAR